MFFYKKILLVSIFILLSGCGSWPTIHEKPLYSDTLPNPMAQVYRPGLPAYITSVDGLNNGNSVFQSQDFINKFIKDLEKMRTFSTILQGKPDSNSKQFVRLAIRVSENEDWHEGANSFKSILAGLTVFVLTPVLRLDYDFEQEITIQASRWDGQIKNYTAKGTASNSYTWNAESEAVSIQHQVVEANRNSLINQLVQDAAFFENKSK